MPWKLPDLMVTTWILLPAWMSLFRYLNGAPGGEALKIVLGDCLAHYSDSQPGLLGVPYPAWLLWDCERCAIHGF